MSFDLLPQRAAQKLAAINDDVQEAHARVLAAQRRIKAVEEQRRNISGGKDSVIAFDGYSKEIERLSRTRDTLQFTHAHRARVATAITMWVRGLPPKCELYEYDQHEQIIADAVDGQTTDDAIADCRLKLEKLQDARMAIARSVPPIEDLHFAADEHVRALALRGQPRVSVDNGKLVVRSVDNGWTGGVAMDAAAFAVWLDPEKMMDKLREQIDELREAEKKRNPNLIVLPIVERDRQLAIADNNILAVEREEEFYIERAADFNMIVERRENADPRAILQVSLVPTKAKVAA